MNYDQLPNDLKRKVDAALSRQPRQKPSRATSGVGLPLRCIGVNGCGEVIERPSESALDTHYRNGCRGTRFEWHA